MPLAVIVLGIALAMFESVANDQQRVEHRSDATSKAMVALERMTREVRQADWVQFNSSREVYLQARVRSGAGNAEYRLVRYLCDPGGCTRFQGPATGWPIPATPSLSRTDTFAFGLQNADVFQPRALDRATGRSRLEHFRPDMLWLRLKFQVKGFKRPVELQDGVSLRNATRFIAPS